MNQADRSKLLKVMAEGIFRPSEPPADIDRILIATARRDAERSLEALEAAGYLVFNKAQLEQFLREACQVVVRETIKALGEGADRV